LRALVISDTHFGAWTGRDLLREEFFLRRLAPALDGIDEVILLGDLFDFLFGSVADAGALSTASSARSPTPSTPPRACWRCSPRSCPASASSSSPATTTTTWCTV